MHFGRGLRGGGHNWGKKLLIYFHVSEYVDHFKAIEVVSLRKKPEITGKVWSGGTPPLFANTPNFFRFFLMKEEKSRRYGKLCDLVIILAILHLTN